MEIKLISSVLFVKDIAESRKFYEDVLDQTALMDHGPNVGFNGGFAIWQQDHAGQMVFGSGKMSESVSKKNAAELYFETGELDEAVKKLTDSRVEFIHPLQEQPWGQRVTRFYDPDGHILELGEPMDCVIKRFLVLGLSPAEIAQRTSMPVEIVNQIVAAIK